MLVEGETHAAYTSNLVGQYVAAGICGDTAYYTCDACATRGVLWYDPKEANWLISDFKSWDCSTDAGWFFAWAPDADFAAPKAGQKHRWYEWTGKAWEDNGLAALCTDKEEAPASPSPTPRPHPAADEDACVDSAAWHLASNPSKGCAFVAENTLSRCGDTKIDAAGVISSVRRPWHVSRDLRQARGIIVARGR